MRTDHQTAACHAPIGPSLPVAVLSRTGGDKSLTQERCTKFLSPANFLCCRFAPLCAPKRPHHPMAIPTGLLELRSVCCPSRRALLTCRRTPCACPPGGTVQ